MDELYDTEHIDNPYQDLGAEYWQATANLVKLQKEKSKNFCLTFWIGDCTFWRKVLTRAIDVVR